MSFGFLGIQIGFSLQLINMSTIFKKLNAPTEGIPMLWIAAPLTGLLVQPIIGSMSDRTWTRLGRRRPYFLIGALLSSCTLFFIPHAPFLALAVLGLWIMDTSFNIAMEPFRAFVGDKLPDEQRTLGFIVQSFFIGIGGTIGGFLPGWLEQWGVRRHGERYPHELNARIQDRCGDLSLRGAVDNFFHARVSPRKPGGV